MTGKQSRNNYGDTTRVYYSGPYRPRWLAEVQHRGRNLTEAQHRLEAMVGQRSGKQERKLGIDQGHDRS